MISEARKAGGDELASNGEGMVGLDVELPAILCQNVGRYIGPGIDRIGMATNREGTGRDVCL